jgi:hypothetical protein
MCSGQDDSCIVDDQGCGQKTLSVENSFRRGTIRTKENVLCAMEDLYRRLPRLLKDRAKWSSDPARAYPTTIRLTARFVMKLVEGDLRRRPFETRSHQMSFDGRSLISDNLNGQDCALSLRRCVAPLLQALVLSSGDINITKLNIGLTNFQDILSCSRASSTFDCRSSLLVEPVSSLTAARRHVGNVVFFPHASEARRATSSFAVASNRILSNDDKLRVGTAELSKSAARSKRSSVPKLSLNEIDPTVLGELPPEIAAEVMKGLHCVGRPTRKRRIDQFFAPK